VKWRCGNFEAKANEHKGYAQIREQGPVSDSSVFPQSGADPGDAGRAGCSEHQRDTIEEERGRKRSKQKVLNRGLAADWRAAAETGEDISRNGGYFEGDENQHKLDGTRHQVHADGTKQNQSVIFAGTNLLHLHVLI